MQNKNLASEFPLGRIVGWGTETHLEFFAFLHVICRDIVRHIYIIVGRRRGGGQRVQAQKSQSRHHGPCVRRPAAGRQQPILAVCLHGTGAPSVRCVNMVVRHKRETNLVVFFHN